MEDFYEAIEPELTDEEIEADYIDHLLQIAPPIDWECYSACDNERPDCRDERLAILRTESMR
jgi:hypothetical protein